MLVDAQVSEKKNYPPPFFQAYECSIGSIECSCSSSISIIVRLFICSSSQTLPYLSW